MLNISCLINILQEMQETKSMLLSQDKMSFAAKSNSVLVRSLVAETLVYYPKDYAIPILLTLLSDKNSDVRSSAAIGLANNLEKDVYFALKDVFLNDKSSIVRAYAGSSLISNSNFQDSYISWIDSILGNERNYLVRVLCYGELYKKNPSTKILNNIFKCFNSQRYQTRCAVLNVLDDILDYSNAIYIFNAVGAFIKKEKLEIILESALLLKQKANKLLNKNR